MTVLGTTLSRRQTVIGGSILLAIVLVVVLIVLLANGGDDKADTAAPRPNGKAATVAPTTNTATAAPTTPAQSPAPKPTTAAANTGGGALVMPAGWKMYHDPTGFSVPIPIGATIRPQGSEVYIKKDNRLLIIDQTDQPKPDPVADWTNQEADRRGRVYRDYHRIRLVPVKFWTKAADWEFTYINPDGDPQHAQKRGVITGPKQAYGISWYTSPGDWAANLKYLQVIYQGFQPKK